jgi:hypothetical protein
VVTIDPEMRLLAEVRRWPVPSRTSEIVVFRREGDEVVYVVPPADTPADKRGRVAVPITDTSYHSVRAVLEGDGVRQDLDYRKVPVLTASKRLQGMDWHIVAKTDVTEALGPIERRTRLVVLLSAGAILIAAATTFGLWRADQASFNALAQRRRALEVETDRMVHVTAALRRSSSALMRARDEDELLKTVCESFVQIGGFRAAAVGVAIDDPGKSVRFVAAAGDYDLARDNVSWSDGPSGRGLTGSAIRSGKVQVRRDYANDPDMAHWRDEAIQRGWQAGIGLPLFRHGEVFGAMTIHSAAVGAFEIEETRLLTEFAADVSYVIDKLRDGKP